MRRVCSSTYFLRSGVRLFCRRLTSAAFFSRVAAARAFCCCSSRTRRSAKRDDREFRDEVEVEGEEGGGGEVAGERADFRDVMKVLSGVSGVSFVTREPFLFSRQSNPIREVRRGGGDGMLTLEQPNTELSPQGRT